MALLWQVLEHCKNLFLWNRKVFPFWRGQELMSSFPSMNGQLPPCCSFYVDSLTHLCAPFKSSNKTKTPQKVIFILKFLSPVSDFNFHGVAQ